MFKRAIFYTLCCVLVFLGVFNVYCQYRTQSIDPANISTIKYDISDAITTTDLNYKIMDLKNDECVYVLFFEEDDINSQYIFNVTIASIISNRGIEKIDGLTLVDISDLSDEARNNLRSRYGFTSAPALAKLHFGEGTIVIDSVITEDSSTLLTEKAVEQWLLENNLIEKAKDAQ